MRKAIPFITAALLLSAISFSQAQEGGTLPELPEAPVDTDISGELPSLPSSETEQTEPATSPSVPMPEAPEGVPAIVESPTIPEPPSPTEGTELPMLPRESTATVRYNVAKLQGLNKTTTKISTIEAPVGTVSRFGNLEIIARACWKSPPEEQPESAALLDIWELKPDEAPQRIFLGWMFASSPGISSLEHPVYDITVLDCGGLAEVPE